MASASVDPVSPQVVSVARVNAGQVPIGTEVTVRGWVRTRRDSKAGLSFLQVHDGSCFDPIQVVAPATLPNYQSEVLHLDHRLRRRRHGHAGREPGQGAGGRGPGRRGRGGRLGRRPRDLPGLSRSGTRFEYLREVAHLRPRTNTFGAVARVRHCLAMAVHRFFHERRLLLGPHADHHRQRRRGRRRDVPRHDARPRQPAAHAPTGKVDFSQDFFGTRGLPDRLRPAQRRGLLPGAVARSTPSARPSAPRTRTPPATSPSSG